LGRCAEHHAVAAGGLGAVEGGVGQAQQGVGIAGAAHAGRQRVGHPHQAGVAGLAAIAVVESLEVVDIEHDDGARLADPRAARAFGAQDVVEMAPVGQAGQAVGHRQGRQFAVGVFQPGGALGHAQFEAVMQPGAGDRDHRLGAQHAQKGDALPGEGGLGQPVFKIQQAFDTAADANRQAHHRARALLLHVRIGGEAGRVRDAVFDDLGAGTDRIAQHRQRELRIAGRIERDLARLQDRDDIAVAVGLEPEHPIMQQHQPGDLGAGVVAHDGDQARQHMPQPGFVRQDLRRFHERHHVERTAALGVRSAMRGGLRVLRGVTGEGVRDPPIDARQQGAMARAAAPPWRRRPTGRTARWRP
jgi:hypothetical protein